MPRRHPSSGLFYFALALLFVFLLDSTSVRNGIQNALTLSFLAVIPSVFPFAVMSSYIMGQMNYGKEIPLFRPIARLLKLPKGGVTCFLIGQLCGFPLGAKCISDGYRNGLFSKRDAERMLLFSNNTGPAFLIGGIGSMFGSSSFGWALYGVQVCLAFFMALVTRRDADIIHKETLSQEKTTFVSAVKSGVMSTLTVVGFVLFFSACISVISTHVPASVTLPLSALLEVSSAAKLAATHPLGRAWAAFAVGFSGVSVHLQTAAVLEETPISIRPYLLSRCFAGCLAFLIFFLFL